MRREKGLAPLLKAKPGKKLPDRLQVPFGAANQQIDNPPAAAAGTDVLPTCSARIDGRCREISPHICRAISAARGSKSRQATGGSR